MGSDALGRFSDGNVNQGMTNDNAMEAKDKEF